jgi:hypothetical protein
MGVQWGDVPAWVGAILTGGTVFAAYITLRRAQRHAERRQADQIHVVVDMHDRKQSDDGCEGTVTIRNRSTAPIYLAQVGIARIRRKPRRPLPKLVDHGPRPTDPFIPYLRDGWKVPIPVLGDLTEGQFYVALFRDANGPGVFRVQKEGQDGLVRCLDVPVLDLRHRLSSFVVVLWHVPVTPAENQYV